VALSEAAAGSGQMAAGRRIAVIGTDTGVGKTQVTLLLAAALRAAGQQVWLHKPMACGDWDGVSSDDGRRLRAACGDGQDPATVCPREFPEACSPHLAARAAGVTLMLDALVAAASSLQPPAPSFVLLELPGGILAPLTADRQSNADLLAALGWPAIVITRPNLGTLNHTQLTVNEARRRGIPLLGLVINRAEAVADSLAVRSAAGELIALTGLPLLADLPFGADGAALSGLARTLQHEGR
jgi:dethiobiotin synthetase